MKKWFKKFETYFKYIGLVSVFVLALGIIMRGLESAEVVGDAPLKAIIILLSAAGLAYPFFQLNIEYDAFFVTLFRDFNTRFDQLNDDLNLIKMGRFMPVGNKTKDNIIQDYLNLCAEEYFWFKKNRIPADVWNAWLEGIYFYLTEDEVNNDIRKYFLREKNYNKSYYNLFDILKLDQAGKSNIKRS